MSYRWENMRPLDGLDQVVAYTGTSAQSTAFPASPQAFTARVYSSTDCHIAIGSSPTATTTNFPLAAKTREYIAVRPGEKIAAIQDSGAGNLYISLMSN